ncbi:MAG: helix-turn-helix domain-containing protein [Bdellovibrionales bacterium]|nr:helix-turn-helix domain-containing protein [Bdellovibrionales bacterium]
MLNDYFFRYAHHPKGKREDTLSSIAHNTEIKDTNTSLYFSMMLTQGPFALNLISQTLCFCEISIELTPLESKVLFLLCTNTHRHVSRKELMLFLWPQYKRPLDKTNHLDVCIYRLRKKIFEECGQNPIVSGYKKGLKFEA